MLAWIILIVSGVLEAVWATALGKSAGFTKLMPSLVFGGGIVASMVGLSIALRSIPVGTGYAVWVGIGAALTVVYAMVSGSESTSAIKIVLILGLIACVVGLKLASSSGH